MAMASANYFTRPVLSESNMNRIVSYLAVYSIAKASLSMKWFVLQVPDEDNDVDYTPGGGKRAKKSKPKKRKAASDDDSDEDWGKKKKVSC